MSYWTAIMMVIYVNSFDRKTGLMWDSDELDNPYLFDYYNIPQDTTNLAERIALAWSKILKGEGGSLQFIQDGCQYLKETYEEKNKCGYISGFSLRDNRFI